MYCTGGQQSGHSYNTSFHSLSNDGSLSSFGQYLEVPSASCHSKVNNSDSRILISQINESNVLSTNEQSSVKLADLPKDKSSMDINSPSSHSIYRQTSIRDHTENDSQLGISYSSCDKINDTYSNTSHPPCSNSFENKREESKPISNYSDLSSSNSKVNALSPLKNTYFKFSQNSNSSPKSKSDYFSSVHPPPPPVIAIPVSSPSDSQMNSTYFSGTPEHPSSYTFAELRPLPLNPSSEDDASTCSNFTRDLNVNSDGNHLLTMPQETDRSETFHRKFTWIC